MRHIKKGDKVGIIAGKFKGKEAVIEQVLVEKQRVRLSGIEGNKRHIKPGVDPKNPDGGIVERLASIHWSNVLPIDPKTKKPSKVRFEVKDNKKVRITKSGEALA